MHAGVDFAAPTGTPIQAAGHGTVTIAGERGAYGNYVRIDHNNGYSSAYAHMSRIAVRQGQRVRQGEVIGYVGSTGRSTGPHLHYEVLVNNRQIDPTGLRLPSGRKLAGRALIQFQEAIGAIDREMASLPPQNLLTARE